MKSVQSNDKIIELEFSDNLETHFWKTVNPAERIKDISEFLKVNKSIEKLHMSICFFTKNP